MENAEALIFRFFRPVRSSFGRINVRKMKELNLEASKSLTSNRSLIIQHFIMYCCTLYISFYFSKTGVRVRKALRVRLIGFLISDIGIKTPGSRVVKFIEV